MNAREAAYLALMSSLKGEGFISPILEKWYQNDRPSTSDFAFAKEIGYGSLRMMLALDYLASSLAQPQKLSLKLKEKALLRTALYQHYFMSKVPLYAIVNETIEIAKKYCHSSFVKFLNVLLRKIQNTSLTLPSGDSIENLSIRFSYPQFFIQELLNSYTKEQTQQILEAGNSPSKTTVRLRSHVPHPLTPSLQIIQDIPASMAILTDVSALPEISSSPNYYIQNITPAVLIAKLAKHTPPPNNILDLCASPGGKLLAAHDIFPTAQLFGNDISPQKISRLSENLEKYHVPANLTCGPGESYTSPHKFDVIILDVPCSNSGVLNKRPEARWRLNSEAMDQLELTQKKLVRHASTLLSDNGVIWYLTCSILSRENEDLIASVCQEHQLTIEFSETILPNTNGWDGGYACLLSIPRYNIPTS